MKNRSATSSNLQTTNGMRRMGSRSSSFRISTSNLQTLKEGTANATFDEGTSANATFNLTSLSLGGGANVSPFGNMPSCGLSRTAASAPSGNFAPTAMSRMAASAQNYGNLAPTAANFAPAPDIFASNAREMPRGDRPADASLGAPSGRSGARAVAGAFGSSRGPGASAGGDDADFGFGRASTAATGGDRGSTPSSLAGRILRKEMTAEEDSELAAFFGKLAERMPSGNDGEDGEGEDGGLPADAEPDPLPHYFRADPRGA